MRRFAVIGGGVSGLSAALRLRDLAKQHGANVDIELYESADRIGGCARTVREGDLLMELGADSFLIGKPRATALLQRLHLEQHVVETPPQFRGARIVHGGRLRPMPPEFRLFAPTSLRALLRSGLLSPAGIARAALEPIVPPRREAQDESVASFVARRFGNEVLERLAQPLIGGIYSGDPRQLSAQATLAQYVELERRYGSLLRGLMRSTNGAAARLASLRDGMGSLADAMASELDGVIRTGMRAMELSRTGDRWTIEFAEGQTADADGVICATPAYGAAQMLRQTDSQLAALLERIRYNSIATVNLVYDRTAALGIPACTGFVVPAREHRAITAATFSSQKYPNRATERTVLVRAFLGGAFAPELLDCSDGRLTQLAHRELSLLAGASMEPRESLVMRWRGVLPQYGVGHVELLANIERRAAQIGGLALAGSAYHGVGIPDCIGSGESGAESIFGFLHH